MPFVKKEALRRLLKAPEGKLYELKKELNRNKVNIEWFVKEQEEDKDFIRANKTFLTFVNEGNVRFRSKESEEAFKENLIGQMERANQRIKNRKDSIRVSEENVKELRKRIKELTEFLSPLQDLQRIMK